MTKIPVIVLVGPTAVGKTNLSIALCKKWDGEVISGDSMQIYKGLDIGTAKITKEEMKGAPHHLIDIIEPGENYSVENFQSATKKLIQKIHTKGKIPFVVGGTGLYIQSVFFDYNFGGVSIDVHYRRELEQKTSEELFKELVMLDPKSAHFIHINNRRRIIRALEVIKKTGKPYSAFQIHKQLSPQFTPCFIALNLPRTQLYHRINERVDMMFTKGIIKEAKMLFDKNLTNSQAAKAIGYKELFPYFEGKCSLEEAKSQIKRNSRHFAKRQLTWFHNRMPMRWIEADSSQAYLRANEVISRFLAQG